MKMGVLFFILSLILSALILTPSLRGQLVKVFLPEGRQVLSQLEFKEGGQNYKLLKLSSAEGMSIELYKIEGDEFFLLDKDLLTDKLDAFYKFEAGRRNLFFKDINGDGRDEIVVPSLDKNMKARLNVFMFDPENETLEKVTKH